MSALDRQVGGDHYKHFKIQPWEFAEKNGLSFTEGNIVKYICRYKRKGGKQDLEKIKHYVDMLIELHYPDEVDSDTNQDNRDKSCLKSLLGKRIRIKLTNGVVISGGTLTDLDKDYVSISFNGIEQTLDLNDIAELTIICAGDNNGKTQI